MKGGSGGSTQRFRWAREGRITYKNFWTFHTKSGQNRLKTANTGMGSEKSVDYKERLVQAKVGIDRLKKKP